MCRGKSPIRGVFCIPYLMIIGNIQKKDKNIYQQH